MSKAARVKPQHRAGEMAQWAKGLATKLKDLGSIPRTTWWKEHLPQVVHRPSHIWHGTCTTTVDE